MEGGSFSPAQAGGYVRATEIMNSKSSNDFRWSVRLTDSGWIGLGIASNVLVQNELSETFNYYDENAIVYFPFAGSIWKGKASIKRKGLARNVTSGDEIHFRFQPKMKKFFISLVRQ